MPGGAEKLFKFRTLEQARNAALKFLEQNGGGFGPNYVRKVAKDFNGKNLLAGKVTTMESTDHLMGTAPYRCLRLDFDPVKGAHFNVVSGRGANRVKAAFLFGMDEKSLAKMADRQSQGTPHEKLKE